MDIPYLIQLLNNKMAVLTNGKVLAFNSGDMDTINKLDAEIIATQDTLNKLSMLQSITSIANAANTSPAELISTGLEASQKRAIVLDDATACLGIYDISSYATDPLHEQKVADILEAMGAMDGAGTIDAYIANEAIGSPLNGHMILTAALKYSVDTRLLMALMEQDSNFGTAGVAVSTFNPGNVGNTGSATHTFGSWEEGVEAVASWLDRHRFVKAPVVETPVVPVAPAAITPAATTEPTPTPSTTPTPSPTPSATPTPSVSPEPTPSSIPTPEVTPTPTPETTPAATSTPPLIDNTSTTTPATATSTEPFPTPSETPAPFNFSTTTPAIENTNTSTTTPPVTDTSTSTTTEPLTMGKSKRAKRLSV